MFIELVDALRCPVQHAESWLVAATNRLEARHIMEGTLGCPVCAAEYPIRDGVVDFRRKGGPLPVAGPSPDARLASRVAALLNLSDSLGFALLMGEWGSHAGEIAGIVELPLVLVDPPAGVTGSPGISVVRADGPIPLAAGTARATAIDRVDQARVDSAVRSTRAKGRILAPIIVALPGGVTELARDDALWIGEREAVSSAPITLHVRRGQ